MNMKIVVIGGDVLRCPRFRRNGVRPSQSFHLDALTKYCLRREQELHSAVSSFAPTNVLIMHTSGARIEGHCSHLLMLSCEHPTFGWS
jgi:hypothetical protein